MNSYQFEDLISDYLENSLPLSKRKKFEVHMNNEIGEKDKVEEAKRNIILLGSLDQFPVNAEFNERLKKKKKKGSSKSLYASIYKSGYILGFKPIYSLMFVSLLITFIFLGNEIYNETFSSSIKNPNLLSKNRSIEINKTDSTLNQNDSTKVKINNYSNKIRLVNDK